MDWKEAIGRLAAIERMVEALGEQVGDIQSADPDLNLTSLRGSFTSLAAYIRNAIGRISPSDR